MAQQNIDFGSFPDDPSADAIRTAFTKVQDNFNQLFGTNANSTVTSINRTPGAGVTVNYPTGNVVISANIACLQVSTTSLKVGRGSDNTQSNVTITSSSQQLNIDIDPANVFSANFGAPGLGLANFNGTLTANSFYQPNINALGILSSLDVSGNANFTGNSSFTGNATFSGTNVNVSGASNVNLGSVSNIHISGGTVGYYLQTNGLGNLLWGPGGGGNGGGSPGGINTLVQFNDAGSFGANLGFSFDKVTGILSTPGLSVANLATVGNITGIFANGNSNVSIPVVDGNVNISAAGNANVFVITGAGANLLGNLTTGNADLGNLVTVNYITGTLTTNAQPNITSVGTLVNLSVTGNITASNVYANSGTIGASLLIGTLTTNAQPNITSVGTLTSLAVTGNANVGNLNVANNTIIAGNLSVLGNATYVNIESLVVEDPIISLGGGPNGDPLTTNDGKDRGTALQYYTSAPVTAFMGWDNSNSEFGFGSNVTISSEVVTFTNYGNVRASYFIGANTQFGNANLGNTATANFFVGTFYGVANSATTAGTVTTAAQPNITSVGTLTSLSVTGNTTSGNFVGTFANGNSNINIPSASGNVNISAIGNSNVLVITGTGINANGTGNFTGNLSAQALYGPLANGNSNINIPTANGNINFSAVGNANIVIVSGTGANITGTLGTTGNASVLGIKTDNYYYANGTPISFAGTYGNSNVSTFLASYGSNTITTTGNVSVGNIIGNGQALTGLAGGNVTGQVGNALVAGTVYTAAQGNITSVGTLTGLGVNGTITGVNITANTGVFTGNASGLSVLNASNVSSGTLAQARLANAAVTLGSTALTLGSTVTTVAGLTSVTSTTFVGALTGAASSATTAGTVTTNAQPNITSVGILTSVSSSGNITAGNIIATGYHIRSVATSISANGISQATATVLTKEFNIVSTVSAGQGVVLPTAVAGMCIIITNSSATNLAVYPASGAAINSLAANAALTHGAGATLQYIAPTTTQWYTVGATYA
jgi:hypothetical protein